MLPPVSADLSLNYGPSTVTVELRVVSAQSRDLHWVISARTHNGAGSSNVTQSGETDGANLQPVGRLVVPANSKGVVDVSVGDARGVLVQKRCALSAAGEGVTPC